MIRAASVVTTLALGAGLLAACSTPDPQTVDGQFPVTVTHRYGETVVPAAPQRIVTLGLTDQDVLLALGIVPAGMTRAALDAPWTTSRLADLRRGGSTPPVEVSLQPGAPDVLPTDPPPDLITAVDVRTYREDYDADSMIAPTVAPPPGPAAALAPGPGDAVTPWQDNARLIGRAVGRAIATERLIADVESRVAAARSRFPELAGRTGACVALPVNTQGTIGVHAVGAGPGTPCSRLLAELGMRPVPGLTPDPGTQLDTVSKERIEAARPDVVVLDGFTAGPRDAARFSLPPGQRVVSLDDEEALVVSDPSVLSLPTVLDTIPAKLADAAR